MPETRYNDDLPGREYRIADCDVRGDRIQRQVFAEKLGIAPQDIILHEAMPRFSKAEHYKLGHEMTDRFFAEVKNEVVTEHPEYNEDERLVEFVTRMYGPKLGQRVKEDLQRRKEEIQGKR